MSSFDYLKTYRRMPWMRRGIRVDVGGKKGHVTSGDGGYVRIRLEGERNTRRYHPQWQTTFYDDQGKVIADYKQQDS